MSKFVPLSAKDFASKGWRKVLPAAYTRAQSLVAVTLDELPHIIPTMPVAFFQRTGADGAPSFEMAALLSLTQGRNLYVTPEGRWIGGYVPAVFRAYPFRLLPEPSGKRLVMCVDVDSGMLVDRSEPDSFAFFEDDGKPTSQVTKVSEFLKWLERGRSATAHAVSLLQEHGLIQPWRLTAKSSEGKDKEVGGLFRIDEAALKALDAAALKKLQEGNALVLAYAQLFSQHRLKNFADLSTLQDKLDKVGAAPDGTQGKGQDEVDIDALFGTQGDDTLKFNF